MLNSDLITDDTRDVETMGASVRGTVVLAGLATAIVVAIWFAFYLLVFVPRVVVP